MATTISKRLLDSIERLPIKNGMRILEIGCGPGVAAREIVRRFHDVYVLAIDRSEKAIQQAKKNAAAEIKSGRLVFQLSPIELFAVTPGEEKFDLVFAVRVGALDGRHPEIEKASLENIASLLKRNGRLYIDERPPISRKEIEAMMAE